VNSIEDNGLQQIRMESRQPIKRLKDKKKMLYIPLSLLNTYQTTSDPMPLFSTAEPTAHTTHNPKQSHLPNLDPHDLSMGAS
jgi:hypothetical protein